MHAQLELFTFCDKLIHRQLQEPLQGNGPYESPPPKSVHLLPELPQKMTVSS